MPGVKRNFIIQYKQKIVLDHTDHPVQRQGFVEYRVSILSSIFEIAIFDFMEAQIAI